MLIVDCVNLYVESHLCGKVGRAAKTRGGECLRPRIVHSHYYHY